ncbi:MAG: hypothetical protein QOF22_387 [Bradyrhizobium sp.]|nr:hypothetical protein [Bradyrhizobium sp.]
MTHSPDRLYQLLPAVHRMRDADMGEPLRALLAVIDEQVNIVEDDIARLYDNWFIETCEGWVVPYIGDLIGYAPVHEAGDAGAVDSAEGRLRNRILVPRRELANTLAYRGRKGTLALLETLAEATAGWPALAIEFYRRLAWLQHLDHLRLERGRTVDLRNGDELDRLGSPFDRAAHSVDLRGVISHREPGRYNIPSAGVFVWRLKSYSVTQTRAARLQGEGPHMFMFSVLGNDTQLYTNPQPHATAPHITDDTNVPAPIRRRAFEEPTLRPVQHGKQLRDTLASARYYGVGKSVELYVGSSLDDAKLIPRERIVPADLTDWHYRAEGDEVAVDPVLGRIVFPVGHAPRRVWATYYYGFSADIGGGEYDRPLSQPASNTLLRVRQFPRELGVYQSVNEALATWEDEKKKLGPEPPSEADKQAWHDRKEQLRAAIIEIEDSAVYAEAIEVALERGDSLQIRAANRHRPVIRLTDPADDRPGAFTISGKSGSRFKLDGIMVVGRSIYVNGPERGDKDRFKQGDLCDVTIRHSTLVPGWALECGCDPTRPDEASLEIFNSSATIKIEHSIVGSIYVVADEVKQDPVEIRVTDSVIDATSDRRRAIGAPNLPLAFARLSVVRSTVLGEVRTHAIELAENSIFTGAASVARRQHGCMRFCYVPPDSRTPRRYHCQPDLAAAAVDEIEQVPSLSDEEKMRRKAFARQRVQPRFNSVRYGTPAYCQLALACPEEITRGAEDESEMGVFHDLFQPQRVANLRARLDEYTPAGMEAGILFAN